VDERFEVGILGPLEVRVADVPIVLPQGRSRSLVALLALEAGRPVSTDRLVDELWGTSPPATVVTALHGLVSNVRKVLAAGREREGAPKVLVTQAPGYLLDIAPEQVDAGRFRTLMRRAVAAPPEDRAVRLREALSLWRGPALAGIEFAGSAAGEATALEELRLVAYEERIDADLALGRHRDLTAEIATLVARHPLRERLYGQLMLALYRSERQSHALEVWRRARTELVEKVGVEPGPGLRRLHQAVLQHDPALELDAGRTSAGGADRDVAARAGQLLAAAGARVFDRHYDAGMAEELFSEAEGLLPPGHPRRADVVDRLPEFFLMLGRHEDADARLARALVEARQRQDGRREVYLRLERARIQLITGPDPVPVSEIEAVSRRALDLASDAGDHAAISRACYVLGLIEWRAGRIRPMEATFRRGLAAAERSGSARERLASQWLLAVALVEGPTGVDDALAECEELAGFGDTPHAGVLTELGRIQAIRGEPDRARDHIRQAHGLIERRRGMRRPAMFVAQRAAEVELMMGEPQRAEAHLRTALALADDLGEADQRARLAAMLAWGLATRGDVGEAEELAHKSARAAPLDSVAAQVSWRTAMVSIRADASDHEGARRLADEATALVPDEMPLLASDVASRLASLTMETGVDPTPDP
jgi:DNA-binding SARP family transcriptional activator